MIDKDICSKLHLIADKCRIVEGRLADKFNISKSELLVLHAIAISEQENQNFISKFCDIDKFATSKIIDRLVKAGWVNRKPNLIDRRHKRIEMSEEGKKLIQIINKDREMMMNEYFNAIRNEDKIIFDEILSRIIRGGDEC